VAELGKEGEGAVLGKALRVHGARCALRMRRVYATVSVRQDTRFVDVQQTRVAKKRKVPDSSDGEPPLRGW
jgi:hypothetical protein